ncbi:Surfactin synthase thioesterase subunit [Micromonospora pallida]|uniref:Surfactin synthase thioesterase subunit n=1 Tax=Micromonospora pallida TaxID=145854 RepID=A0A1C6SDB8_9ACTN|nr:alpha/beta fold hydrolase [Micromonospora pallida]SCL27457.1 Surfactin synthase thioesterase subunit [Micromonospora pallida]
MSITRAVTDGPAAWIVRPRSRPRARVTLVCFHSASSGAAMYRRWPDRLPETVDVALVRMPGRENRLRQPFVEDFDAAVAALSTALGECGSGPYALLGHSMGAHLAFAVAGARVAAGLPPPRHLFLCGTRPPHLFRPAFTAASSDGELIAALTMMGGTDPALLANEELRRMVLPTFRADLRVCAGVRPPRRPLPCPLSVFGGEQDDIPGTELDQWRRWSSRSVTTSMFPGRHFFLVDESEDAVLGEVGRVLAELTPPGPDVTLG